MNPETITRRLPDGRELTVYPILYGARLAIGMPGSLSFDDIW